MIPTQGDAGITDIRLLGNFSQTNTNQIVFLTSTGGATTVSSPNGTPTGNCSQGECDMLTFTIPADAQANTSYKIRVDENGNSAVVPTLLKVINGGTNGPSSADITPDPTQSRPTAGSGYESVWATGNLIRFDVKNKGNNQLTATCSNNGSQTGIPVGQTVTATCSNSAGTTSITLTLSDVSGQLPSPSYGPAQYFAGPPTVTGWPSTPPPPTQPSITFSLSPDPTTVAIGNYQAVIAYDQTDPGTNPSCGAGTAQALGRNSSYTFIPAPPPAMAGDYYMSLCWEDSGGTRTPVPGKKLRITSPPITVTLNFWDLTSGNPMGAVGTCTAPASAGTANFAACDPPGGVVGPVGLEIKVTGGVTPKIPPAATLSNPSPNPNAGIQVTGGSYPNTNTDKVFEIAPSAFSINGIVYQAPNSGNGEYDTDIADGSIVTKFQWKFGWSFDQLCSIILSESPVQNGLTLNWRAPVFAPGPGFDLLHYELIDENQGGNSIDSNISKLLLSKTYAPLTLKVTNNSISYRIRAVYRDLGNNIFYADSKKQITPYNNTPPTLFFEARSLKTNAVLPGGLCQQVGNSPSTCNNVSILEPASLHIYSSNPSNATLSVPQNLLLGNSIALSSTDQTWEIVVDNVTGASGGISATSSFSGNSTIQNIQFDVSQTALFPGTPTGALSGTTIPITWTAPTYGTTAKFAFVAYDLLDASKNVIAGYTNLSATSSSFDITKYQGYQAGQPLAGTIYVRARYLDQGLLPKSWSFDTPQGLSFNYNPTPATITYTAYELYDGTTLVGTPCTNQNGNVCTTQTYNRPVLFKETATHPNGTPTLSYHSGPASPPFTLDPQARPDYLMLVESNKQTTTAAPLDMQASVPNFGTTIYSVQYSAGQSDLFPLPSATQPVIGNGTVDFSWKPPTLPAGNFFSLKRYQLWLDAGHTQSLGTAPVGATPTYRLDLQLQNYPGYSTWDHTHPFPVDIFVSAEFEDSVPRKFFFDLPLHADIPAAAPITTTYSVFELSDGTTSLGQICKSQGGTPCGPTVNLRHPALIVADAAPANLVSNLASTTNTGPTPIPLFGVPPPAGSPANALAWEMVDNGDLQLGHTSNFGTIETKATSNQGVPNPFAQGYQLDLSELFPASLIIKTIDQAHDQIIYQWNTPPYGLGGAGFSFDSYDFIDVNTGASLQNIQSNVQTMSYTLNLMQYPGYSTWKGQPNQPATFSVKIKVRSNYKTPSRNFTYDTVQLGTTLNQILQPTITYTAYKLSDGTSLLGTCASQGANPCPAQITYPQPFLLVATASVLAQQPPDQVLPNGFTVTTAGPKPPMYPSLSQTNTWEVVESGNGNATTSLGTLNMTANTTKGGSASYLRNYQAQLGSLYPSGLTAQQNGSTITYQWSAPTYQDGPNFKFVRYDILDAKNNNNVLTNVGNATTYQLDLNTYPGFGNWRAAQSGTFPVNIAIRAVYTDTNQNFTFDGQPSNTNIDPAALPLVKFDIYKLSDSTLVRSCTSATPCPSTMPFTEPVKIVASGLVAPNSPVPDPVSFSVVPPPQPPATTLAANTWEIVESNKQNATSVTLDATAITQLGGKTEIAPTINVIQSDLFPRNPQTPVLTGGNLDYSWGMPLYGNGGPGFSFVGFSVIGPNGSLATGLQTGLYSLVLSQFPGYTTWFGSQTAPFPVSVTIESVYKDVNGTTFVFDSQPVAFQVQPGPTPTLTWQVKSLANPSTVIANCVNPAPTQAPNPPCSTGFFEPVQVTMTESIINDTISNPLATILDPASSPVTPAQNGNVFTWRLASSLTAPTPLPYTANASAVGVKGGRNSDSQTFTLNLGSLFPTPYTATTNPSSISTLDFSWALPLFVDGPGFRFQSLEIFWDSQTNSAVTGSPQLFVYSGPMNAMPLSHSIDFDSGATQNAYRSAGSHFTTNTVLRVTYRDMVSRVDYTFDIPYQAQTAQNQPPQVTFSLKGVISQNILCVTHNPVVNGECVPSSTVFNEPATLTISAMDPENSLNLPYTPSVSYPNMTTPPASSFIPPASWNFDLRLPVTYLANGDATDSGNVTTTARQFYTFDMSAYTPSLLNGTTPDIRTVVYKWKDPTYGRGTGAFQFQYLTLMWDDSTANKFGGQDQVLQDSIDLGVGSVGVPINFDNLFPNLRTPGQQLVTHAYLIAHYTDMNTGNQYTFRTSPSFPLTTAPNQRPKVTFTLTGIPSGTPCVTSIPGGGCPQSLFSEPAILNISAIDSDGSIHQPYLPTVSFTGGSVNGSPTTVSDSWDFMLDNALTYNADGSATDDAGATTNALKTYTFNLSAFLPTFQGGQSGTSQTIDFTWVPPAFASVTNFMFVKMALRWDSNADPVVPNNAILLDNIPQTMTGTTINFKQNTYTANAFATRNPINQPFQTHTYLETTWRDGRGNLHVYNSITKLAQTGPNAPPTVTYKTTGIATGNTCQFQVPGPVSTCPTIFTEPVILNLSAIDSDGSVGPFVHSVTFDPGTGPQPVAGVNTGPNAYDHVLKLDAMPYLATTDAEDDSLVHTVYSATYNLNLSSFVPASYGGTPQSLTTIRFTWARPTFVDTAGMQWVATRIRWRDNITDPPLVTGLGHNATSASIDFSQDPNTSGLFSSRPGLTFQTLTYMEFEYADSNHQSYFYTTPTLTMNTTQNVTLQQPGIAVSVGITTITGQWTASSSDLLLMTTVRARAVDGAGNPAGSVPVLTLPVPTNPINTLTLTVGLLQPNTSFTVGLDGSYNGSTFFSFLNSTFTATTNAAVPPSPTVNLLNCNVFVAPISILLNPDVNFPDSQYAISITSNTLPPAYLNATGTLQASPFWQTMAQWGAQAIFNDAGLANTLAISTLVLDKNSQTPIASPPTIMTTPGGNIGTQFPAVTTVAYDNLVYGVPLNQGFPISFTTNMDKNFVETTNLITLKNLSNGNTIPISRLYADTAAGHILTITPQRLSPVTLYQIDIAAGLRDACGFVTQQSFSQEMMTTIDPAQNATVVHPLDPARTTAIDVAANTLTPGSFVVPRIQGFLIKPNATVTAAPSNVDAAVRANRAFREIKRMEVLVFNSVNGSAVMGDPSAPIKLTMSANNQAIASKSAAPGISSIVDPATLSIFRVDTSAIPYHLLPVPGAINNGGVITAPITRSGTYILAGTVSTSLNAAYAWPVPFKPSAGHTQITFDHLGTNGTTIKIFTIMGELVKEINTPLDSIQWDVKNADGDNVASGVYLYQIKNAFAEKRGKLMIVR